MIKRFILAIIAVFVVTQICDFVVHGLILASSYQATASLWRPMNEMKLGLMNLANLITIILFIGIYQSLVSPKSIKTGGIFGFLYGLAVGVSMSLGTYSMMPIPVFMAVAWFLGCLISYFLAGLVVGLILKK